MKMKKFFMMFIAVLMMGITASAQQTTVEGSKFFNNTYVGVSVGGQTGMNDLVGHNNWTVAPTGSLYLGKWLTPVFGLELNGDVLLHDGFSTRNLFVDATYVGLAGRVNLNNVFHVYKGHPDQVEVIPFVGFGWLHGYGNGVMTGDKGNVPTRGYVGRNALATKMGVDLAINLGEARAMSINVRPTVEYALSNRKIGYPHFDKTFGRVGLEVGFTYKFGYKNSTGAKTHNFTKAYTVKEFNDMVDELSFREPDTVYVTNEVIVERVSEVTVPVETPVYLLTSPYFAQGKYNLDATADVVLDMLAEQMTTNDKTYTITGYASLEGVESFNHTLSDNRAKTVYDGLVKRGVEPSRLTVVAGGATDKFGDAYELNRTVKVVVNE